MDEVQKKKIETISLDVLEKIGLVTTDIFSILGQSKKEVTLLKAGEYVLPEFIDKFRAKGITSFYVRNIFSPEENNFWLALWKKIESCQKQNDYENYQVRNEFIKEFKEIFFDEKKEASLLSYVSTTHQYFSQVSNDFLYQYAQKNYLLFKRSMVVASLSLPLVLSFGYGDLNFLKDIYNITLLLSYHLADEKFTVTIKNALSLEGMEKGLGVKYLRLKSPQEIEFVTNLEEISHVSDVVYSYQFEQIKDLILFYKSLIVNTEHENKIFESEIPDWMSAVIFIDKIIHYDEFEFKKGDAKGYLKNTLEKKCDNRFLKSYGFRKLKNLLDQVWNTKLTESKLSA
jgi:hypothetical protein